MIHFPKPLVGICAYSGTGKTTLLTQLLPRLKARGLRVAVVKHAHHNFDIDHPGKDSHNLRIAGAEQMVVASGKRLAWIKEREDPGTEPDLSEALNALHPEHIDLVLVEGFKREAFPKIELHRPALGKPLIYPDDANVIAIAVDTPLTSPPRHIPILDLNNIDALVEFICDNILH